MQQKQGSDNNRNTKLSFNFNSLLNINSGAVNRTVVEDEGKCLKLSESSWESIDFNYSINADTVLTFEFKSEREPELSMIVFDSKEKFLNALSFFKIHGSLKCNDAAFGKTPVYNGHGNWQRFSLPIGRYLKGQYTKLAFAIEDDCGKKKGDASFKNVEIHDSSQTSSKTVMLFSKPNPKKPKPPKRLGQRKEGKISQSSFASSKGLEKLSEITNDKMNPFLSRPVIEGKTEDNTKKAQLCASGVINGVLPKGLDNSVFSVESVVISGMTAGLSASYKSLLSMLSLKTNENINNSAESLVWNFVGTYQDFAYLTVGEVLSLTYTIKRLSDSGCNEKTVIINVFGTKKAPLILQELFIVGQDSELQVENIFDCRNREMVLGMDDLSIDIKGPMKEEFKFQIDTETEIFSFNPSQFTYLEENEILEFHFNLGNSQNPTEKIKELFSVVIVGHLKIQPSIIIIQDPFERKKLFSFLECAVLEGNGKVLRDERTVSTKQMGPLVFSIGKCSLECKQRSFSEPELEICEDSKLFTESTKVDLKDDRAKGDADFPASDLKVI